jgi:hypothetical protein
MNRVSHHLLNFCCVFLSTVLISCNEQAQETMKVDCSQIAGLLAVDDWQTLAAEPFVEKKRDEREVETHASAKKLMTGFDNCRISRTQYAQNRYWDEVFRYTCNAPASTANGEDNLGAAKSVASQWRSCFEEWDERAESRDLSIGSLASVAFQRKGYIVNFSRSCVGICSRFGPGGHWLFGYKKEPVKVAITKFVRPQRPDTK